MGIWGLTSYISQNSQKFYQPLQLHDCTLVIDGCSLACQLYCQSSKCNSAFGGDYNVFAKAVERFLSLLEQCNVTAVVVIDGGYEAQKLNTVFERFKEKILKAKICNPVNQSTVNVFPLLLMEVFKQTLFGRGIKFVQADFEADYEIAAIARHLGCPVLSCDSDFYIYDVLYIPYQTLNRVPIKIPKMVCLRYYLGCEVYKIEKFISKFGGLDKALLPLVAVLLGNDYIPSSIFCEFVNNQVKVIKNEKMSHREKKIAAIFKWLKNETRESATTKLLNTLKKKQRKYIKRQIEVSFSSYSYQSSDLITYLGMQVPNATNAALLKDPAAPEDTQGHHCDNEKTDIAYESSVELESANKDLDTYAFCDETDCDLMKELTSNKVDSTPVDFPIWLKLKFRRGELTSWLADICHLHSYFCQPQVEDFTLNDSHNLSFPILEVISGLLLSDGQEKFEEHGSGNHISCYSRGASSKCQIIELKPARSLPCLSHFPPLSSLPSLPFDLRKNILYSTLGITNVEETVTLKSLGSKWELYASAVVFWARSAASVNAITNCHLQAIIICMIVLALDEKLGCFHSKNKSTGGNNKKHKQNAHKKLKSDSTDLPTVDLNMPSKNLFESLDTHFTKVSESECSSLIAGFSQFRQVDSSSWQFSPFTVHVFAQLQACLLQTMSLNSLLGNPVPQCQVSEIFCGSMVYGTFVNLEKRKDVEAYVRGLLMCSPSMCEVYKALLDKFKSLLPTVICEGARKGKRKKSRVTASNSVGEEQAVAEGIVSNLDVNNKFALLAALSGS